MRAAEILCQYASTMLFSFIEAETPWFSMTIMTVFSVFQRVSKGFPFKTGHFLNAHLEFREARSFQSEVESFRIPSGSPVVGIEQSEP